MVDLPPFHPTRPHLIRPVPLDRTGEHGPTVGQARGAGWRRTSRGYYLPATVSPDDPDQRAVEASVVTPPCGAITGWAALHWLGGAWFDGTTHGGTARRPVTVATAGRTVRPQPGIAISEEGLPPHEIELVDGLWVTTPLRSTCFEMRYAPTDRDAAVALSMAAYSDLVSLQEMAVYAAAHSAWTGIPRCRRALPMADENAWSPQEVLMLNVWQDAGHRRPLCNVPVFDRSGRFVGTPDLIDPEAGVIGEYDGSLHLAGEQRAADLRREAEFRALGLEPVVMVGADVRNPDAFVRRLDGAYRRARNQPESSRAWTIEPPTWWTPTLTVDQRRALSPDESRRWLRHRRAA